MADPGRITWKGKSGTEYEYTIHAIDAAFRPLPGNYIFAQQTEPHMWRAVYVGQTSNLEERLEGHEKEACAKRNGATHIHAHLNDGGEASRKKEEADLIARLAPKCNEQLGQK